MADDDGLDELMPDWGRKPTSAPPKRGGAPPPPPQPPPEPLPPIRVPPHSLEAEQSVLGALLLDGGSERFAEVRAVLHPKDFYRSEHVIVFECMERLVDRYEPLDAVTVANALEADAAKLDRIGGAAYLAELVETTPSVANAVAYAQIVREKADRRMVIRRASLLQESAFDTDAEYEGQLQELRDTRLQRDAQRKLVILTGEELMRKGKPIPWIWRNWLPAGMLTLLAAEKGKGKSTLTMGVTACLTRGRMPWDDREASDPRTVAWWTGEEHISVLVARATAAGVDFNRFRVVEGYDTGKGQDVEAFDPSESLMQALDDMADDPPDLLVIDPIIRLLKGKNIAAEDVRKSLDPVAARAEEIGIALLGIGHFAKSSGDRPILDRFLGSQAWTARARMVWALIEVGDRKFFGKAATNLAPTHGVIEYRIKETPVEFFEGDTDISTLVEFGEVNADESLDEVERRERLAFEAAQKEAAKMEDIREDMELAESWLRSDGRNGVCTSNEWRTLCEGHGWKWRSDGHGGKVAKAIRLGTARRKTGVFRYLPDAEIPDDGE